jgi:hypothetical protein
LVDSDSRRSAIGVAAAIETMPTDGRQMPKPAADELSESVTGLRP